MRRGGLEPPRCYPLAPQANRVLPALAELGQLGFQLTTHKRKRIESCEPVGELRNESKGKTLRHPWHRLFDSNDLFRMVSEKRAEIGDTPWGAAGLEWQIQSPPTTYNFQVTPKLRDEAYNYGPLEEIAG